MSIESHEMEANVLFPDVNSVHGAWRKNRDTALKEFFAELEPRVNDWFFTAAKLAQDKDMSGSGLWFGLGTTVAVCVDSYNLAATGYFNLAALGHDASEDPPIVARLWYERSLGQAQRAGDDFAVARAAYCLGRIDAAQGAHDGAREVPS